MVMPNVHTPQASSSDENGAFFLLLFLKQHFCFLYCRIPVREQIWIDSPSIPKMSTSFLKLNGVFSILKTLCSWIEDTRVVWMPGVNVTNLMHFKTKKTPKKLVQAMPYTVLSLIIRVAHPMEPYWHKTSVLIHLH